MKNNNVTQISRFGQSIWLDFFERKFVNTGELQELINEYHVTGITSNPSIFEKAISSNDDYDKDIKELASQKKNDEDIFYELAISDIQRVADMFTAVYAATGGNDGLVSLEVSPELAGDTEGTIQQARKLWKAIDRENVMIKIPATAAGIPAIHQCISEGININITLLFGLDRYEQVVEAYVSALEKRVRSGLPINMLTSVASFFLSRIDVLTDPLLAGKGLHQLKGESVIAAAKIAYQKYLKAFHSERFLKLETYGAKSQRLLWASTATKDAAYSDVKYVEALIGPETINTVPLDTLKAFADYGEAASRLASEAPKCPFYFPASERIWNRYEQDRPAIGR